MSWDCHAFDLPQWFGGKKNPPAKAGDTGSIPGLERSPGEGNGTWLQYSCLKNPMDRGAWRATVRGVAKELGHDLVTEQKQYTKHCQTHVLCSNSIYNFQKVSYNKLQWYYISIDLCLSFGVGAYIQKRPILLWRSQMNRDHILLIITSVPLQNDHTSSLEGKMHKPVCWDYIPQFGTGFGAAIALWKSCLTTFYICKMKALG